MKNHSTRTNVVMLGDTEPNTCNMTLFRAYTLSDYNNTGLP
jgi:hypothetical protein